MENFFDFLKGFNLQEIISLVAVTWFMTNGKYKKIREDLGQIKNDLKNVDSRLTRLEGRFEERGYWESRNKKLGEE